MPKSNKKIELCDNLKMGVADPTQNSTFYKVGTAIFIVISLFLAQNIYAQLHKNSQMLASTANSSASINSEVLGAYDNNTGVQPTSPNIQTSSYTVQPGDTLFTIGSAKNVPWDSIATLNNLKAPYNLKPGMSLKIPNQ